jgi:hypothetical protein
MIISRRQMLLCVVCEYKHYPDAGQPAQQYRKH